MSDTPVRRTGKPLLFNSIPKCGKNLVVTFLSKLEYRRIWFPDPGFNRALYAETFKESSNRAPYLYECQPSATIDHKTDIHQPFRAALKAIDAGHYAHEHVVFDPRLGSIVHSSGIASLFIYRDPRDALVSALNWARNHRKPAPVATVLRGMTDEEALLTLISGEPGLVPFAEYFDAFHGWKGWPSVLVLRFEDMIGPRGGGREEAQRLAFNHLAKHLGWNGDPRQLEYAIQSAYNPGAGTFHRGQIGTWKEYFTPAVTAAFNRHGAYLLEKWGYE